MYTCIKGEKYMTNKTSETIQPKISIEVQRALHELGIIVNEHNLEYVSGDSLTLALCSTKTISEFFNNFNLDLLDFKHELDKHLDLQPKYQEDSNKRERMSKQTVDFQRAFTTAVSMADEEITVEGLLLGLLTAETSSNFIKNYLEANEISLLSVKKYFTNKVPEDNQTAEENNPDMQSNESHQKDTRYPALEKYGVNLTEKANKELIDPVIGRNKEVGEIINILGQRRKNNPLLVGDAGVGKTTIAEGLALKIKEGNIPEQLKDFQIFSIEVASLMAGAKYRGDLEERLQKVIKEASSNPNIVLFIDEIHQIIGSGNSQQNSGEAANILKPALASGAIKVIGATTFKEFREIFQKDSALERRFQKVDVEEPTMDDSLAIIKGIQSKFENFHKVSYTEKAIEAAVRLSVQFQPDKKLPDKAIDLIDMAGSRVKLSGKNKKTVSEEDIAEIISSIAKIPVGNINADAKSKLKNLDKKLKGSVLGQDKAIDELIKAVTISRAGLSPNKNKPIGNFLFSGPTGTGKTELAKQLSQEMGVPLIRFDMSEYGSKHEVAKLVGAPPGYVGFNEGGKLTEMVKQKPNAIVLLDEIEKAHPDVFNILLQVMEDGRLTDGQGRTTDFKNTILIMTSNAGASIVSKKTIGFNQPAETEVNKDRAAALKSTFAPEFLNRLDSVIQFNALTKELITKITENNLNAFMIDLFTKNVSAVFTQAAKDEISDKGFDKEYGARPLQRFIKDNIISKLSLEIVHGELEKGGQVIIDFKDGNFDFDITAYEKVMKEKEVVKTSRRKRVTA